MQGRRGTYGSGKVAKAIGSCCVRVLWSRARAFRSIYLAAGKSGPQRCVAQVQRVCRTEHGVGAPLQHVDPRESVTLPTRGCVRGLQRSGVESLDLGHNRHAARIGLRVVSETIALVIGIKVARPVLHHMRTHCAKNSLASLASVTGSTCEKH